MPILRTLGLFTIVTATIAGCAMGFVFWHHLLGLLFATVATLGIIFALVAHLLSTVRKKPNELGPTFTILALTGLILFTGWWVRAELREEAMVAESLRVLHAAELLRKREARIALSIRDLYPTAFSDRMIAWIAGGSVRYVGGSQSYKIVRGEFIDGDIYDSTRPGWRHTKI